MITAEKLTADLATLETIRDAVRLYRGSQRVWRSAWRAGMILARVREACRAYRVRLRAS